MIDWSKQCPGVHQAPFNRLLENTFKPVLNSSFLIVDDICDGGATFCNVTKYINENYPNSEVNLCVTHGLFSKGREVLHNSGINKIFTTNSLLRNHGQENVFEV